MPSDRSRTSDDRRQRYNAVVTQQGRVILDRDFNALQEIVNGDLAADATDIIGPCGTPDDGFKIGAAAAPAQSPPEKQLFPLGPLAPLNIFDFGVGPGTMYVGGQRACLPAQASEVSGTGPLSYSYYSQPDWLFPTAPANPPGSEVVSLHVFEQEVGAVEDPDLLEVALGGPDTTQRVRLMERIERAPGTACADAAANWASLGFVLDPKSMRLIPQVALQASYQLPPSIKNPCDPIATGGYLGAYNQLIRVELRTLPSGNSLLWGYDNASSLYRVQASGTTLTLAQAPVDAFHQPLVNQYVEVLRTASILAQDPNAADPANPLIRCVAEARGYVTTLSSGFAPSADGMGGTVVLASALPTEYNDGNPLFLRIWQGVAPVGLTPGVSAELIDFAGQSTGLSVTLTFPAGATVLPLGSYWMLAVRPSTPQLVYPERFLERPQSPDGPRQWMCPLAVINWNGSGTGNGTFQLVQDCRNQFTHLVGLNGRNQSSCCTYRVGDGLNTFGDFTSIQAAIDQLPKTGGEICVLAGRYFENLRIEGYTDLVIHGCGADTRIASPSLRPVQLAAAAELAVAVISVQQSQGVELCSFVVEAAANSMGVLVGPPQEFLLELSAFAAASTRCSSITLCHLVVTAGKRCAISAAADFLQVEHCLVAMENVESEVHAVFVQGIEINVVENWVGLQSAAPLPAIVKADLTGTTPVVQAAATVLKGEILVPGGLQIGGRSRDVYVRRNEIQGGSGIGITLGSLGLLDSKGNGAAGLVPFQPRDIMTGACCGRTIFFPGRLTPERQIVVAGVLINIHLENNRIRTMGLGGIGPVAFFDLAENQEVVSIDQLFIVGNEINQCPNQPLRDAEAQSSAAGIAAAYGAIVLPDVAGLVIRDNQVLDTGASLADPVCGIFLLHGEQVEISRNQITDARDTNAENTATVTGLRAGIAIGTVTPPSVPTSIAVGSAVGKRPAATFIAGLPALTLRDNIVQVPAGLALSVAGVGAFMIQNNHLASGGQARVSTSVLAKAVMILNFGTPIESPRPLTVAADVLTALASWDAGATIFTAKQVDVSGGLVGSLGPGPIIFSGNRCVVQLPDGTKGKPQSLTSTWISTFDDLSVQDNQFSLQSVIPEQILVDTFTIGAATVRVAGNRFQQTPAAAAIANLAVGVMNISSLNISTGPVFAIGPALVNAGNLIA